MLLRLFSFQQGGSFPLGKSPAERHAGWAALAVAGSDTPVQLWDERISGLMFDLGWRDSGTYGEPPAESRTLEVLRVLAGATHKRWRPEGIAAAVAASARAATRA